MTLNGEAPVYLRVSKSPLAHRARRLRSRTSTVSRDAILLVSLHTATTKWYDQGAMKSGTFTIVVAFLCSTATAAPLVTL